MTVLCRIINSEGIQKIIFVNDHHYYMLDVAFRRHNKHIVNYIELAVKDVIEILSTAKQCFYLNEEYIYMEGLV